MVDDQKNNIVKQYSTKFILNYYNYSFLSEEQLNMLKVASKKIVKSKSYLHITTEMETILESGKLKCSSGGLGGVEYVVPIFENNKIHNLGNYIVNKELPMFMKNNGIHNKIDGLKIELENTKIGIVDYLESGEYYLYIFENNENINQKISNKIIENMLDDELNKSKKVTDYCKNNNISKIFDIINSSKTKIFLSLQEILKLCGFVIQLPRYRTIFLLQRITGKSEN